MAQKRRTRGGRVTPSKKALARAAAGDSGRPPPKPTVGGTSASDRDTVAPSSRYTPAKATYRRRPRWHRLAGWLGIVLGVTIAVLNDAMLFMEDGRFLPFGHQEAYLLLGIVIAGSSTWFLGLFDRGTTVYD